MCVGEMGSRAIGIIRFLISGILIKRVRPKFILLKKNDANIFLTLRTAMKIHISNSAKEALDQLGGYQMEHRGKFGLRNKLNLRRFISNNSIFIQEAWKSR